jgi:hypothetical protein
MGRQGVELMILILKQKRPIRMGALKALDYALTNCPAACERFVDMLGLKSLFGLFMGRGTVRTPLAPPFLVLLLPGPREGSRERIDQQIDRLYGLNLETGSK